MEPAGHHPSQDWRQRPRGKHCRHLGRCDDQFEGDDDQCEGDHLGRGGDGVEGAEQADRINLGVVGQAGLVELEPDLPGGEVRRLDGRAELAWLVRLTLPTTSP